MAICYDSIITYLWYLWLQSTKHTKMCIVLCLSVRVCYLPIIAKCYLQMLFFLLFSDLYSNQIKLYSHNYTTLPKALKRMWVFYFLHNWLYCLITASFNYSEVFFEFLCHTGESVCVVVDMTDFKCCDFQYPHWK